MIFLSYNPRNKQLFTNFFISLFRKLWCCKRECEFCTTVCFFVQSPQHFCKLARFNIRCSQTIRFCNFLERLSYCCVKPAVDKAISSYIYIVTKHLNSDIVTILYRLLLVLLPKINTFWIFSTQSSATYDIMTKWINTSIRTSSAA